MQDKFQSLADLTDDDFTLNCDPNHFNVSYGAFGGTDNIRVLISLFENERTSVPAPGFTFVSFANAVKLAVELSDLPMTRVSNRAWRQAYVYNFSTAVLPSAIFDLEMLFAPFDQVLFTVRQFEDAEGETIEYINPLVSRTGDFEVRLPNRMVVDGNEGPFRILGQDIFRLGQFIDRAFCPHWQLSLATAPFNETASYDPDLRALISQRPAVALSSEQLLVDDADVATPPTPEAQLGPDAGLIVGILLAVMAVLGALVAFVIWRRRGTSKDKSADERSGAF